MHLSSFGLSLAEFFAAGGEAGLETVPGEGDIAGAVPDVGGDLYGQAEEDEGGEGDDQGEEERAEEGDYEDDAGDAAVGVAHVLDLLAEADEEAGARWESRYPASERMLPSE